MLITAGQLLSQETESKEKREKEELRGSHRITVGLGHTHLAKGKDVEGKMVWLPQTSWSLNYNYWISNKWGIGLQSDFVMEKFVVESNDDNELERERPIAVIPVAIFKPFEHFSFIAGVGIEFEKSQNLGLFRLGAEYGCELPKGWEAGIGLAWDNKWGNYNSWVLEFSFSKIFYKKKRR